VIGDLDSGNWFCASLVERLGIAVIAVDYRLAPEHRFPAAADDCIAALSWIADNAAQLGIRADGIAVGGDSAGGNLAAVCAIHARDTGSFKVSAQILLYPVTDISSEHASYERNADGYMLTAVMMRYFKAQYLDGASAEDWRASPLLAKLDGVAPALVVTCGYDPLCDEGDAYAAALKSAGVSVRHIRYDGQIHGFAMWSRVVKDAHNVMEQIVEDLKVRLFA
jgi:acetyl esterase